MMGVLSLLLPAMACFSALVALLVFVMRSNARLKRENQQLTSQIKQQAEAIKHVQTGKKINHSNATATDAELNNSLSDDGYLRD